MELLFKVRHWMSFNIIDPITLKVTKGPAAPTITPEIVAVLDEGKLAIVIDRELAEIPAWVELQISTAKFTLFYQNGSSEELNFSMPKEELEELRNAKAVTIVSNENERKLIQRLRFVIKD